MVADSPGRLLENNFLILNLNDPCAIADADAAQHLRVGAELDIVTHHRHIVILMAIAQRDALAQCAAGADLHIAMDEDAAEVPDADAGADLRFGASVPDWPAFPDSAAALAYLKQHYKLVILSNVDRVSFAGSNRRLGVEFDAIYTAQDIGSYKPDPRNFAYMLDRLQERGIGPAQILHTAQSLFHDHAPAKRAGLASCWIDRRHAAVGWGATPPPPAGAGYDFRFTSMAAMADAHRAAIGH